MHLKTTKIKSLKLNKKILLLKKFHKNEGKLKELNSYSYI